MGVTMIGRLRTWPVAMIALASLLLGTGAVVTPVVAAEEALLIPGATVFKQINPLYPLFADLYQYIGVNFHNDDHPQVIDYSQNPFVSDRALVDGVRQAELAVRALGGEVVVIGESMGSMVASRLATELATSPDPPSPDDIRFVLIASPEEGVAKYFAVGTYIPLLNYRVSRVSESPYPTTVVIGEYDGWADPPDRPWNLVALANAMLGILYAHGPAIWGVDPAAVPPGNTTVEGTVTTYLVPSKNLPLTRPLRDIGVPDSWVDRADEFLRPIVDAGYIRHDLPGDTRPYLSDGLIRRNSAGPQQTRDERRVESGGGPDLRRPVANGHNTRRQGVRVGSGRGDRAGVRAG
jgi:pimeloyl-ACP methyl ester carboxylesterase